MCFSKSIKSGKLFFYLILALPVFSLAQEYSLSGNVIGVDNAPVPYADIILQDKDSVVVKWGVTDDAGKYSIENIKPASYILKVSILGYKTKITPIAINEDLTEYTTVLEQEVNELKEVIVKQPRVERKLDRLIFNVQNTTLSNGSSWNALTRTPTLFVSGNEISVKGRETPLIFINDRRVYLSSGELKQFLESTPANTLKSIEVIANPPAKYDAEGKAIVNIVMGKNPSIGYNANVRASYEQGVFPKHLFSTGHFYKTEKINLYASYSNNYRKEHEFLRDRVIFFTDDAPSGSWFSETWRIEKLTTHNISTNIDYDISDKHSIGLSALGSFVPNKRGFYGSQTEAIDSSFYTVNRSTYTQDKIELSLDYKYDIGDGKKFTANIYRTNYNYDKDQNIETDYSDSDQVVIRHNEFTNDKEQFVEIYSGQLDYTSKTKKSEVFETGMKWYYVTFDNRIDQQNIEGETPDLYDRFLYDETNFAAYLSHEKSWEYWEIKLGLRGENTAIKGVSVSESQTNTQNYFKLFPSLHLGYSPSENHNFVLSYNRKISRPRFGKLNPFRLFLNDNSYVTGNPDLLPTLKTNLNLTYTLNQAFDFYLYFIRSINPVFQLPYVDHADNKLVYRHENLDKGIEYGLDISWNKELTPWWYLSISSSIFYEEDFFIATQNDNAVFKNNRWITYQNITNSFTLSKDKTFTGDIEFTYLSESPNGNYIMGERSAWELRLQKTLWGKRATLSFEAFDVFNKLAYTSKTDYLDQNVSAYTDFEYRKFELSFIYRFGNYKLKTNRKSIRNAERNRL